MERKKHSQMLLTKRLLQCKIVSVSSISLIDHYAITCLIAQLHYIAALCHNIIVLFVHIYIQEHATAAAN